MPKEPLYPHVPKSQQPQFPHVTVRQTAETAGPLPAVTVICPICGKEIEVPEYNAVTRSDALREHLKKEHPKHPLLLQVTVEGGEPVPPQYRDLVGLVSEPIPGYSLLTLPVVVPEVGESKLEAVMKQLKNGVEGIQDSYQFRLFLTTMSKFHDYSIGNQILIMMQEPNATHVAGFVTWKELGRWVKKGGKSISILAPRFPPRPTCPKCGAKVPKGAGFCLKCGASVEEGEIEVAPAYFIVVSIFDISQTDGKPLPEFEVPVLTGEVNEELFGKLLDLMKAKSVPVSFESRPHQDPGIKGQYSPASGIWIRPEEPRAQQLKSLAHEIAHHYSEGVFRIPRQDAETIAESAAFVVGAHYGFDTGVRSFPYVALWARDKKVLEKNLGDIRKVATTIIDHLA
jgi:predicted nucleic acid-binding Zn ribbon protein